MCFVLGHVSESIGSNILTEEVDDDLVKVDVHNITYCSVIVICPTFVAKTVTTFF